MSIETALLCLIILLAVIFIKRIIGFFILLVIGAFALVCAVGGAVAFVGLFMFGFFKGIFLRMKTTSKRYPMD